MVIAECRKKMRSQVNKYLTILLFMVLAGTVSVSAQAKDALLLYNQGRYESAINVCIEEIASYGEGQNQQKRDSLSVLGWSLISLKRYQDAVDYSLQGLKLSVVDYRLVETLGEAYFYLGQNKKALKYFESYVSIKSNGSRIGSVYYFMGEIFLRTGEYHKSDMAFTTAVHLEQNSAFFWSRLGYAREMAEDYSHSAEAYDRAIKLKPSLDTAKRGKERVLQKQS